MPGSKWLTQMPSSYRKNKGPPFWLVEFKGEPLQKKEGKRAPLGNWVKVNAKTKQTVGGLSQAESSQRSRLRFLPKTNVPHPIKQFLRGTSHINFYALFKSSTRPCVCLPVFFIERGRLPPDPRIRGPRPALHKFPPAEKTKKNKKNSALANRLVDLLGLVGPTWPASRSDF